MCLADCCNYVHLSQRSHRLSRSYSCAQLSACLVCFLYLTVSLEDRRSHAHTYTFRAACLLIPFIGERMCGLPRDWRAFPPLCLSVDASIAAGHLGLCACIVPALLLGHCRRRLINNSTVYHERVHCVILCPWFPINSLRNSFVFATSLSSLNG